MRSALAAMQATAKQIFAEQTLLNVERRSRPSPRCSASRASRARRGREALPAEARRSTQGHRPRGLAGAELGELTRDIPKAMVNLAGKPLLAHIVETYRAVGVKELTVVRGYKKEAVNLPA
jgi:phosphoenolpyruvate phosphomutase